GRVSNDCNCATLFRVGEIGFQGTERTPVLASCYCTRNASFPWQNKLDMRQTGALGQAHKPADSAKFISSQSQDQWVFSKFKGTDVLGPENGQIGNVNDMLFDKQGKILGLIVGVGGFLGIGEKNVAIDMSAFQPVPYDTGSSTSSGSTPTRNDDPTMVKLKVSWTKDQLKNAPDFQYYKAPSRTSGGGGAPTTGIAPRPTAPTARPAGRNHGRRFGSRERRGEDVAFAM